MISPASTVKPKVYLFVGTHPVYHTLVAYPPAGFDVVPSVPPERYFEDTLEIYSGSHRFFQRFLAGVVRLCPIPRVMVPPRGYDLIHSSRGFIPLSRTPSVLDVEIITSFTSFYPKALYRARYILEKLLSRNNVRFILPHSLATMKALFHFFGRRFVNKLRVLYPAAPIDVPLAEVGGRDTFTILFVGRLFIKKGGLELYRAYRILKRDYPHLRLILKTDPTQVPDEAIRDPNVTVIGEKLPYREALELYSKADVFIMPTYMDSFGYVFLEAMAAGLPLIGTDQYAVPEIIEDGFNGFIVHSELKFHDDTYIPGSGMSAPPWAKDFVVDQLVDKIRILLEDPKLARKLGRNSLYLAREGKFSVKHRNDVLSRIYDEAISGG